jgi:RNA polymerase sigma-70 factor, ECF subfamily
MRAIGNSPRLEFGHASRMMIEGRRPGPLRGQVAVKMPSDDKPIALQEDFAALIATISRDRDRMAFAQLFAHFAPRVKTLMLRIGAPRDRAEELAQETLLTVWHKAHLFDPRGASASGWIFRIARNLRIDGLRRDQRLNAMALDAFDTHLDTRQPDGIVSEIQLEGRVRSAVAMLSREQIQVITLSFFEDRPHAEIAERLELPLGTVKSRIRLAMKRLRDLLDDIA